MFESSILCSLCPPFSLSLGAVCSRWVPEEGRSHPGHAHPSRCPEACRPGLSEAVRRGHAEGLAARWARLASCLAGLGPGEGRCGPWSGWAELLHRAAACCLGFQKGLEVPLRAPPQVPPWGSALPPDRPPAGRHFEKSTGTHPHPPGARPVKGRLCELPGGALLSRGPHWRLLCSGRAAREGGAGAEGGAAWAPTSLPTSAPSRHAGGAQQPPCRPSSAQPAPQNWTQL